MDKHTQQRSRAKSSWHLASPPVPATPEEVQAGLEALYDALADIARGQGKRMLAARAAEAQRAEARAVAASRPARRARRAAAAEEAQAVSARQQGEEAVTRRQEAADEEPPR